MLLIKSAYRNILALSTGLRPPPFHVSLDLVAAALGAASPKTPAPGLDLRYDVALKVSTDARIQEEIEELSCIYARVMSRPTRVVSLPGRKCDPQIVDTFLGYELKVFRKRITCPDMTTARYLRIFAGLGMAAIRTPYDPTHTIRVVPELERCLKRIKEHLHKEHLPRQSHQSKVRSIYRRIRDRLKKVEKSSASTSPGA